MSELSELEDGFEALNRKNEEYLPKVDPALRHDLLRRESENPGVTPMYLVEVFTKPGLDTEQIRQYIISKTGMCPAIYDKGTHYATNQKLTINMLKEISDSDDVLEVTGEFTGGLGSYGASHEHRDHKAEAATSWRDRSQSSAHSEGWKQDRSNETKSMPKGKLPFYIGGIFGVIVLVGMTIGSGLVSSSSSVGTSSLAGEPGVLYGYVAGPFGGLPAIGTTVTATDLETGESTTAFVSIDGQYILNLAPFSYSIVVAFPDGTSRIISNALEIDRGTAHELNIAY